MYYGDDWPKMADGSDFDGQYLFRLLKEGQSPFRAAWDVNLLLEEIEQNLNAKVTGIPLVSKGANQYGFHLEMSNGTQVMARLAQADYNMPNYDGFPIHVKVPEARFEAEIYELLREEQNILVSKLMYHRLPQQRLGPRVDHPQDIVGRQLFVFEKAMGRDNVWRGLTLSQQIEILEKSAAIRSSLFNYNVSLDFASLWLRERLFEQKPLSFPIPVAPTREFCVTLFTSKIEATIRNVGDMIGWEEDELTVGPLAAAAKASLLRFIPHMLPADEPQLYRLVLDHGDFGIHNMTIDLVNDHPHITSLFDWERGCIVPAILSDPELAVIVDLVTDEKANPSVTRVPKDATSEDHELHKTWTQTYFESLFASAPSYKNAIRAGKDARHLWFALKAWRGDDPEDYFGALGHWAEVRMKDLGITA